jgi:hypothetical protein
MEFGLMLKSEKILFATTMLVSSIAGGTYMLSLKPEEQKQALETISPIIQKNPLAPVLVQLREIKQITPPMYISVDPLEQKHTAREGVQKILASIPKPPTRPKFKEAYQAIAAHFRTVKEPTTEPTQALAYAPQPTTENPIEKLFGVVRQMAAPTQPTGGVAVYKITDHTVTLPDGTKIEAHSGLGHMRDNPQYQHVRMRGPTPVHVYNLSWRERPFHGVKAIRLTPLGGERSIYNRDGLLAHTYMLNPQGASNGCVSFRDYTPFQRAFERGEIRRLAVVP